MSGDENPKRMKIRPIRLILLLVIFAVIIVVAVSLISSLVTGSSWITNLFAQPSPEITVDEFNFEIGRDRVFAHMNGSIAAVGTLGVKVLDADGREALRVPFRMTVPAVVSSEGRCIAFDIGGSAVRVFDDTEVIASFDADGPVVSASINQNGWFCVVMQDGGGHRGTVSVFDNIGRERYRAGIGTGFPLSAAVSADNRNLAIISLTDNGSRVTFFHDIDTEEEVSHMFDFRSGIILDMLYLANGYVLAVSTDRLISINSVGEGTTLYSFSDKRLGGYTLSEDFVALHLYDYGLGHQGRLVTLLTDGTILGEMISNREIISMSSCGKSLVILKNDGVSFFSKELEEFPVSESNFSTAGAGRVLAVNENVAVATSDNSAVVVRREEER